MLRKILLTALTTLTLALPLMAQQVDSNLPPLAFVQNKALYTLDPENGAPILIDDTLTYDYEAVWSADGSQLAYVVSADGQAFSDLKTLKVWDSTQAVEIVTSVQMPTGMPINWTRDGKILYFVNTNEMGEEGVYTEVYTVEPTAGAVPELVTNQLELGVGCGGGSSIPMDQASWEENGFGGIEFAQLTDFGLVYPSFCAGNRYALFRSFSNEVTPFTGGNLTEVALSPDQRQVAGLFYAVEIEANQLVVVNLETMEESILPTMREPVQVAWGADNSLYYVSVTEAGNLLDGLTDEQLRTYSRAIGVPDDAPVETMLARNTLSVSRIAPDGTETLIFEGLEAYTIGRMQVVGNTLYFSTIASGAAWVQAVLDGQISMEMVYEDVEPLIESLVPTTIYSVDLSVPGSSPTVLQENATQFAVAGQ